MLNDQQTRRRSKSTGVTFYDPEKACPGYVLYTPIYNHGHVDLIDLRGDVVHRWGMPHPPAFTAISSPTATP